MTTTYDPQPYADEFASNTLRFVTAADLDTTEDDNVTGWYYDARMTIAGNAYNYMEGPFNTSSEARDAQVEDKRAVQHFHTIETLVDGNWTKTRIKLSTRLAFEMQTRLEYCQGIPARVVPYADDRII